MYFIMVDRFANGDPTNDPPGTDLNDPHAWHGGDLAGILQNVDWLDQLGVTTVWLSPLMKTRYEPFFEWGAFHGYWVEDHGQLDPAYGTEDELRALSAALSERGMSLVLDMVYNHSAMDGVLLETHPDWFHTTGAIEDWDDPLELQNNRVHGLPDLDQDNAEVYEHLLSASRYWVELAQPAGFRIDAVRHMPPSFLARLDKDLGDVWMLAEVYDGNPAQLRSDWDEGGFESVFDFPLHFAMVDVFCKDAPMGRLAATLSMDRIYEDPQALFTFLDNHDRPRIQSACGENTAHALDVLFSLRGTPTLTWGTEVGIEGAEEPENRAPMRFDAGPLQERIQRLAADRSATPALGRGDSWVSGFDGETLSVTREADGQRLTLHITDSSLVVRGGGPDRPKGTTVVHFKLREGDVVAGAGPELGNWDPANRVRSATVPHGTVLEYKHVDMSGESAVWEDGPNRYLWVP
jgi:glycosidase